MKLFWVRYLRAHQKGKIELLSGCQHIEKRWKVLHLCMQGWGCDLDTLKVRMSTVLSWWKYCIKKVNSIILKQLDVGDGVGREKNRKRRKELVERRKKTQCCNSLLIIVFVWIFFFHLQVEEAQTVLRKKGKCIYSHNCEVQGSQLAWLHPMPEPVTTAGRCRILTGCPGPLGPPFCTSR